MSSKIIAIRLIGHSLKIPSEFNSYLDAITTLCSGNGELSGGMSLGDMYVQYAYNSDSSKLVKKFSNDVNLKFLTDGSNQELKTVSLGLTFENNEIIPTLFDAAAGVIANERIPTARFEIDQNNTIALKKMPFIQESAAANNQSTVAGAATTSAKADEAKGKGKGNSVKASSGEPGTGTPAPSFEASAEPHYEFDPHEQAAH
ncbi:hypothetical protein ACTG16_21720 [Aeromonas sp. 23P]|uniref:hypothetical protein n=1 Tax=Aeromonas sp. 23P TaxID=3452716 RepID=UPI003F79576D